MGEFFSNIVNDTNGLKWLAAAFVICSLLKLLCKLIPSRIKHIK